jgi:hypothetical protein
LVFRKLIHALIMVSGKSPTGKEFRHEGLGALGFDFAGILKNLACADVQMFQLERCHRPVTHAHQENERDEGAA